MGLGLKLPTGDPSTTADYAVRAEACGYESVWQGELWGDNVFVELAAAAERTTEVRLGTSIVNVFSRSPAVIAMGARSLDNLSDGRAVVGLGVSTAKAIEDLHSMAFEKPIRRTRETVELVKAFLTCEHAVDYEGDVFSVADFPALDSEVPVYNAALGPANRRVTGRVCDGWLPSNIPFSNLGAAFETVATAAREAGRDPDEIEVAPWVHVAVDDENPENARDLIRDTVAYYVGSGVGYENAVGAVFPKAAEQIASAWRSGGRERARASVTDEMIDDLGCAGRTADVRERLQTITAETPADTLIIDLPQTADVDVVERTIDAVAPTPPA